jgi:hypothetical protein
MRFSHTKQAKMLRQLSWKSLAISALPTILFYAGFFGIAFYLNDVSPSGPCTPGLAVLFVLLLPFISVGLLIKNLIAIFIWKKPNHIAATLHLIVLAFIAILYFTS